DACRPGATVNLALDYAWLQNGRVDEGRLAAQKETVERVAELCQHHGIILLQPSRYRVFDGSRVTAYSETDEPQPLGPLGQALLAMEQLVRSVCPRHVILRTGWILDDSRDGVLGRFLHRLEKGEPLELADDRRGNPCPVDDVARVILAILKQLDCAAPLWGTYHYGAQEATTVLALGQCMVAEARNLRTLP